MSGAPRLSRALSEGSPALPVAGRIAVFAPRAGTDLSVLPEGRSRVITGFKPDHDHFAGLGFECDAEPEGRFCASIVFVPRSKPLARALIAQAAAVTDGPVIVDGAKEDGIESILRSCRERAEVSAPVSKAHGKLFWFPAAPGFEDWAAGPPQEIAGGYLTAPGVFSADSVDPASKLLADLLPAEIGASVADLGGGWGYLSARALERPGIEILHLVEADHAALACARRNVADARLRLYWEDATRWRPDEKLDAVITNPPFHIGRKPDPVLGRAFAQAAAAMLKPRGQLFLVANRHLPYEAELARHFAEFREIGGDARFKVLLGARPARKSA